MGVAVDQPPRRAHAVLIGLALAAAACSGAAATPLFGATPAGAAVVDLWPLCRRPDVRAILIRGGDGGFVRAGCARREGLTLEAGLAADGAVVVELRRGAAPVGRARPLVALELERAAAAVVPAAAVADGDALSLTVDGEVRDLVPDALAGLPVTPREGVAALTLLEALGVAPDRVVAIEVRATPPLEVTGAALRAGLAGLWIKRNKKGQWRVSHAAGSAARPRPLGPVAGLDVRLR